MRVLLVQPYTFTIRGLPQIPLALMYIGGRIEKNGHTVKILDRNVETNARRMIEDFRPDVLGVTSLTGKMILDGIRISRYVRKRFPETTIVWGGVHASTLPEATLQEDFIDYLVVGEGEESFVELLSAIENGGELSTIPGIAYKSDDGLRINPRRPFIKDLDSISFVPWHLIDPRRYLKYETLFITSRGCPHQCAFCYNEKFNMRRWRAMSPGRVKEEIDYASRFHPVRRFRFDDDNFCVDRNRFHGILDILPRDVPLYFESRVDYIDEEFCRHVAEFRDAFVFLGVESGDDAILKRMKKDITVDQIRNAYALINRYNIKTSGSFVIGSPGETREALQRTLCLLEEIRPTRPSCCIFVPFPGSLFTEDLIQSGGLANIQTLSDWGAFTDSEYAGAKQYSEITYDELNKIYRRFWRQFVWNFVSELRLTWILAGIQNLGINYWRTLSRTLNRDLPCR